MRLITFEGPRCNELVTGSSVLQMTTKHPFDHHCLQSHQIILLRNAFLLFPTTMFISTLSIFGDFSCLLVFGSASSYSLVPFRWTQLKICYICASESKKTKRKKQKTHRADRDTAAATNENAAVDDDEDETVFKDAAAASALPDDPGLCCVKYVSSIFMFT